MSGLLMKRRTTFLIQGYPLMILMNKKQMRVELCLNMSLIDQDEFPDLTSRNLNFEEDIEN